MKRQVQLTGVKKWFGDDWVSFQNELFATMEGLLSRFGTQFVLSGCEVTGSDIASGIVLLYDSSEGWKICKYSGSSGVTFPAYLKLNKTVETRLYQDDQVKNIAEIFGAVVVSSDPGGDYLEIPQGSSPVYLENVIQGANYRFVTDAEKANYSAQATNAISTIRASVATAYNTLEKLKTWIDGQLTSVNSAIGTGDSSTLTTIRGGIAADYDTLAKLKAWTDQELANLATAPEWADIANKPVFEGFQTLSGSNIDMQGKPILHKTLTGSLSLTFSNYKANRVITLRASGDFALTLPSQVKVIAGAYEGTEVNLIQFICVNDTQGSEEIWALINRENMA